MTPFDFIRLIGATFILAYSIAFLDLPFGIARRLRDRFPDSTLLRCPYCLSPWLAAALYIVDRNVIVGYHVVSILAVAGWTLLFYRHTGANHV